MRPVESRLFWKVAKMYYVVTYSHIHTVERMVLVWMWLTVATILFTAAAESSSPLDSCTSVMPKYFSWKTIPSNRVSRVSVQFSGSSLEKRSHYSQSKFLLYYIILYIIIVNSTLQYYSNEDVSFALWKKSFSKLSFDTWATWKYVYTHTL